MKALALCLVIAVSGCSFLVHGPPDNYSPAQHGPPACNRSAAGARSVDILGVIFGSIVTLIALSAVEDSNDFDGGTNDDAVAFLVTGAVGTGLHVGALITASSKTGKCKKAAADYKTWKRQQRPVMPPEDRTGPPGSISPPRW